LQQVTRLSLWQGVKCLRLKLWDEETRTLVGFDALPRSQGAEPARATMSRSHPL
jgi:hypothetical protein